MLGPCIHWTGNQRVCCFNPEFVSVLECGMTGMGMGWCMRNRQPTFRHGQLGQHALHDGNRRREPRHLACHLIGKPHTGGV